MNFAPYQDTNPEAERALSPPPPQSRDRSFSPSGRSPRLPPQQQPKSNAAQGDPWGRRTDDADLESGEGATGAVGGIAGGIGGGFANARERVSEWETSLPLRVDVEAALAYLILPPAAGVILLLVEWRSDYVRFHAWQSSLLFAAIFVIHLIFSWSTAISWILFVVDIALILFLAHRAYRDADTLERFEVPFFGRLASSILDDE
ncbi:MAG: hypothetical protein M4579_000592 [Chaenotheca gracillima]|nr:MAG: hypothetical protein M4579_000592 [Chaenotheca gracillima]